MSAKFEKLLSNYTQAGERLIWRGRPRRRLSFEKNDIGLVLGTLFFSFIFYAVASRGSVSWLFVSFLILPCLLVARFVLDVWRRVRAEYALTNQRALISGGFFRRRCRDLPLATMTDLLLTERRDGSGTIAFSRDDYAPANPRSNPPMFNMIEHVRPVYDLIRDARVKMLSQAGSEALERRWTLPAAESAVLLWGPKADDRAVLKLALWEGIVRSKLSSDAEDARALARAGFKRTKRGGYVKKELLPELERLRLLDEISWEPTTSGAAMKADLIAIMALGQGQFTKWVSNDRVRAREFVERAGPAVLLLDEIHPDIVRLQMLPSWLTDAGSSFNRNESYSNALNLAVFSSGIQEKFAAVEKAVYRAWDDEHPKSDH